jgi:hypothetical protein
LSAIAAQRQAERADGLGDRDLLGDARGHFQRHGAERADHGLAVLDFGFGRLVGGEDAQVAQDRLGGLQRLRRRGP